MSSFSTKRKNLLCLRFDTCFHGHYFEIYYIFVKLLKRDKVVPKIVAHTLPSFLPLDEWERECLSTDLQVHHVLLVFHADLHAVRFSSSQQLRRPSRAVQSSAGGVPLVGVDGLDGLHARFDRFRAFPAPTRLFRRFAPSPQRGADGERGCGVVSARCPRANQSFIAAQVGFRASRFVGSVVRLDFVVCFLSNPLNIASINRSINQSNPQNHSFPLNSFSNKHPTTQSITTSHTDSTLRSPCAESLSTSSPPLPPPPLRPLPPPSRSFP